MEDANWQDDKSLADCNKYMLDNSVSTDVTFVLGEKKKELHAHKYVLGSRSSVFYAMLFGPMAETTSIITIPDIEPDIFYEVLRYMYYEEVSITTSNMTSLMIAADKYNVEGVVRKCTEFMDSSITVESVCAVLDCAAVLHKEELRTRCLEYIFENPSDVLKSSSFRDLHRGNLEMILQSDDLDADEEDIFESVKKWGENRCIEQNREVSDTNIRSCLGDLITLIRFPVMDVEVFANKVSSGDLLTDSEKVKIFHWYFKDKFKDTDSLFCKSEVRKSDLFICMRGSSPWREGWEHYGSADKIDFFVSDTAKVKGFVMIAPVQSVVYNIDAKLLDASNELNAVQTVTTTPTGEGTFRVMFKSGTHVRPGVRYTASVQMTGQQSRYGNNYKTSVTAGGVVFAFITAESSSNGTSSSSGQIPGIIFSNGKNRKF